MKRLFLLLFSLGCFWLSAQSEYKTHTVQKGETIYGIGKRYGISQEQVYNLNPNYKEVGIQEGDILVIPANAVVVKPKTSRIDTNYIQHQVQPKETLYGLSQRYGISKEEILKENPLAINGLKIGEIIFIPKKANPDIAVVEEVKPEKGNVIVLVKPQETIYGYCRKYGLSEVEFYRLNPLVKEQGLKIGMQIQVPTVEGDTDAVAVKEPIDLEPKVDDTPKEKPVEVQEKPKKKSYFLYQVKVGDGLEAVANRHGISKTDLIKLNPEVEEELIPGRFIILPNIEAESSLPVTIQNKWISSEEIAEKELRIAVVLPFYLSMNDSLEVNYADPTFAPVYGRSKVAIEFYNGFKQAMDTLASLGLELKIQTIDSDNNLASLEKQKRKIEVLNPHFIVGPLYAKNAEWIATEFPDVPVISPLSRATDNKGMINLIKCHTEIEGEWLGLAGILNENYLDYRIVFVNPDNKKNREGVELIKQNIQSSGTPNLVELWLTDGYPKLDFYKAHVNDSAHKTVWVITSEDQAFINDFLTKMYSLKTSNMKILATSKVLDANTIQNLYLSTLNIQSTSQNFVDYKSPETEFFIKTYRENCGTEPSVYAFKGYDTGIYFTLLAARYGGIPISRSWPSFNGLEGGFNFIEARSGGPVNKHINILEVVDFTLQRSK